MTGSDFYADLIGRGFRLRVVGGDMLRVTPAAMLSDEDREAIRIHKPDLLACTTFCLVWAILTNALERRRQGKLPLHSKDFWEALMAYERLSLALGPDVTDRLEQLSMVPA